jgi:hypothetical protein
MPGRPQGHSPAGRKILLTPSGIESATLQWVAKYLKQLRHRNCDWIVVPSLSGFISVRFLLEEQIYLAVETMHHRRMLANSGSELLDDY